MFHLNPTTARRHAAQATAVLAALAALAVGIRWGTFAVGGSDSYGYVSQAEMWAQGRISVLEPRVLSMPWPKAESTMIPLGYRMSRKTPGALVPKYPPGLPLVMAAFRKLAGRDGPFFVVPVLGALSVWLAFLLGRSLAGPSAGALAAVLLAASPIFLYQVTQPMSDVPAMAWWLASITLLIRPTDLHVAASGAAASLAVLTRPNLAPMVVVVVGLLLAQSRGIDWRIACRRLVVFGLAAIPACGALAWINSVWYGAWYRSGYGAPDPWFSISHVPVNLRRYIGWLVDTHTPCVLAGLLTPALLFRPELERRAVVWACWSFALGVFALYLPYMPWNDWWFTRFLLPGLPPLLVLGAAGLVVAARWLAPSRAAVIAAAAAVALAAFFTSVAADRNVFRLAANAQRFPEVGAWIARETPSTAVVFAEEHSGSVRYYAGRLTVDWIAFDPEWMDFAVASLRARQVNVYAVFDGDEDHGFRERFRGTRTAARLDDGLVAQFGQARIYDLRAEDR
jgi:4-amino-4-deoxy-L-arabinose transferase-like glycosyltransferase